MQGIVGASKYSQTHGHALGHIHTHIATCLHTQLAQFTIFVAEHNYVNGKTKS